MPINYRKFSLRKYKYISLNNKYCWKYYVFSNREILDNKKKHVLLSKILGGFYD